MGDASNFVRLHISPLDAELVKVVIPASLQPVARNISYHTLETFPERRYGFVDLPEPDAEKLRRKLNGTTLKGCKMRVEKARPEARIESTGAKDEIEEKKEKEKAVKDKSKKRKREPDVLEGVALHDRQVKRGWTEASTTTKRKTKKDKESKDKEKEKVKEKRKRPKSKYTEGEECLLKTKLPPNTIKNLAPAELEEKKRSKKKGRSSRQVVIHEFEKTTKFPSFLKTSTTTDRKAATEFVEGKGWVDEEGNLVEEVKEKEKEKLPRRPKKAAPLKKAPEESDDDDTSSSGTSSEGTSSEDEEESEAESEAESNKRVKKATKKEAAEIPSLVVTEAEVEDKKEEEDSDASSDNTSDSDESDDEEEEDAKKTGQSSKATNQTTPTSSKTTASKPTPASTKPLAIQIPPPETPTNDKVHPLEALYKRPKPDGNNKNKDNNPTSAPKEAEPFSFFGAADDNEDLDETPEAAAAAAPASLAPMTPYTREDFEWRNVRSAAPTPDTAHPSRAHLFWGASPDDEDVEMEDDVASALREDYYPEEDEEQAEGEGEDEDGGAQARPSATTDFQKWFWDNRRDLNRSWMTRRKTAAKEKRHRENKARASKAV